MSTLNLPPTLQGTASLSRAALDALDINPELAARLGMLDAGVFQLETLQSASVDSVQARLTAIQEARAHRSRILVAAEENGTRADPQALARADASIERAVAAQQSAVTAAKAATTASAGSRDAVREVHALLNQHRGDLVLAEPVPPPDDANLRDLVAQQREELKRLDAATAILTHMPMLLDDAIGYAKAAVLDAAKPIKVTVTAQRVDVDLPTLPLPVRSALPGDSSLIETPDTMAILAGLLPEVLQGAVETRVREFYSGLDNEGISDTDRAQRLGELAEHRAEAEAIEVAALMSLWEQGDYVGLRPDTNPKLLLGIA